MKNACIYVKSMCCGMERRMKQGILAQQRSFQILHSHAIVPIDSKLCPHSA